MTAAILFLIGLFLVGATIFAEKYISLAASGWCVVLICFYLAGLIAGLFYMLLLSLGVV